MVKKQEPDIPVTPSSGNVFADLGFAEPEEELTKAPGDARGFRSVRARSASGRKHLDQAVTIDQGHRSSPA